MSRQLLKQALDMLLSANVSTGLVWPRHDLCEEIKAELEKPDPEPVAWMTVDRSENRRVAMVGLSEKTLDEYELKQIPLYTSPPQQKQLSDEEINTAISLFIYADTDEAVKFGIKYAEKSHGIT